MTREQRLEQQCNQFADALRHIFLAWKDDKTLTAQELFGLVDKLTDFMPERRWWQYTYDEAMQAYRSGDITGGRACEILNMHLVEFRGKYKEWCDKNGL